MTELKQSFSYTNGTERERVRERDSIFNMLINQIDIQRGRPRIIHRPPPHNEKPQIRTKIRLEKFD